LKGWGKGEKYGEKEGSTELKVEGKRLGGSGEGTIWGERRNDPKDEFGAGGL